MSKRVASAQPEPDPRMLRLLGGALLSIAVTQLWHAGGPEYAAEILEDVAKGLRAEASPNPAPGKAGSE